MTDLRQAAQQALEALIDASNVLSAPMFPDAVAALSKALAQEHALHELARLGQEIEQAEPVAWLHNFIQGGISIGKRPADLERHPDRWTALYKDPKPCPTCEALARTVMLDQTSHDTTPPQRTERPVDCERCNRLEEQAYDLVGELRVANIKLSMRPQRPWQGLTDEDWGWIADRKGTSLDTFDQGAVWAQQRLMERNK